MRSKIKFELQQNGNLVRVETLTDKIYQGAVGVTEYFLQIAENVSGDYKWLKTDNVFVSFERPDGKKASLKMTHNGVNGWEYTSSGWETDVDISEGSDLKIAFISKRYSTINPSEKSAITKTTQEVTQTIHPSGEFIIGEIELDEAELLWNSINLLETDKVGRYNVEEIENISGIIYEQDGLKTPQNIYYNFESAVQDLDGITKVKNGAILVTLANGVQTEFFITNDRRMFTRNTGGVFKPATLTDLQTFAYSKTEIIDLLADKQDKTDLTLQTANKTIVSAINELFNNKQDKSDPALQTANKTVVGAINELKSGTFVNLVGDQNVSGVKTFLDGPIVPSSSSDQSAINRGELLQRTYTKEQVDTKFVNYGFDTEQNFFDWLDGTFARPDGKTKADLIIGNKIIIKQKGVDNYQVANEPVLSLSDFKVLVEDNKDLAEIAFTPKGDINETNADDALMAVNRKTDLKSQIAELANLVIEPSDWTLDGTDYIYNYEPGEFTNELKQDLAFNIANDTTYNSIQGADIDLRAYEITTGAKFVSNKLPAFNIELIVKLISYEDIALTAEELTADKIGYDNLGTNLLGENLQVVATELNDKIEETKGDLDDLNGEVVDLGIEIDGVASLNVFDKVIRTQSDWNAMIVSPDWFEAKTVAITSSIIVDGRLNIPVSVTKITGIGLGTLNITIPTGGSLAGVYGGSRGLKISDLTFQFSLYGGLSGFDLSLFNLSSLQNGSVENIKVLGTITNNLTEIRVFSNTPNVHNSHIEFFAPNSPIIAFSACRNSIGNEVYLVKDGDIAFRNCVAPVANYVGVLGISAINSTAYSGCSNGSSNRSHFYINTITDNCTKWSSSND